MFILNMNSYVIFYQKQDRSFMACYRGIGEIWWRKCCAMYWVTFPFLHEGERKQTLPSLNLHQGGQERLNSQQRVSLQPKPIKTLSPADLLLNRVTRLKSSQYRANYWQALSPSSCIFIVNGELLCWRSMVHLIRWIGGKTFLWSI